MKQNCNRILSLALTTLALHLLTTAAVLAGAFFPTGAMTTPRSGQTATLLTNGMVLVAGGSPNNSATFPPITAAAELYDPATGEWQATGSMNTPRENHTATLLPDGRVLVAGGTGTNLFAPPYFGTLTNAEVYDPATGVWTPTTGMTVARRSHTASLLPNGKVLVAGGTYDLSGRCELYDPVSGTWTLTGTMTTNRQEHAATLLTNGMVLVVGGQVNPGSGLEPTATAELYNPNTGDWTATGSMTTNRFNFSVALLKDGKALVEGGIATSGSIFDVNASAELYDPVSGTWSATGSMLLGLGDRKAPATLLPDGEVLVGGEIYNPTTGQWAIAGSRLNGGDTATLLADGQVLLAGSLLSPSLGGVSAQLFDPDTAWKGTGSLNIGREAGYTMTLLTNGEVLVAGGNGYNGVESSAELFDPATGEWTKTGDMTQPREYHTATLLPNGKVLVAGGHNFEGGINNGVLSMAELYDPVTGTWTETGEMNFGREKHQATLLTNGQVLVTGRDAYNNDSAELYDPVAGTWSVTASTASFTSGAILLPDGEVLAIESNGSAELYDPSTGTWSPTGSPSASFLGETATLLADGRVLVLGNYAGLLTDIYDPASGTWTTNNPTTNRVNFTATLLQNGKVLVAGGPSSSAQIFDPADGTWTDTFGPMTSPRSQQQAVLLPDGRVLVAGGNTDLSGVKSGITVELFDPTVGSVTTLPIVLQPLPTFTGGAFEFNFTAASGQSFTVWATTNIEAPFNSWRSLGAVTEVTPGQYQYSDSQAASLARRFYRVTSP
ncbi:MAG TPA: kelch repeat-containing protein [Verrucomicrobiae bacterium]|nr:kelch repeat-containing protein [Verrucomicrobiae bacterium]